MLRLSPGHQVHPVLRGHALWTLGRPLERSWSSPPVPLPQPISRLGPALGVGVNTTVVAALPPLGGDGDLVPEDDAVALAVLGDAPVPVPLVDGLGAGVDGRSRLDAGTSHLCGLAGGDVLTLLHLLLLLLW